MKLQTLLLKNFRCYKEEVSIDFKDITTIIGKNDSGKSTILEALEIFFNNELIKIDQRDANINSGSSIVEISCVFNELPDEIIIDAENKTNLKDEYLVDLGECLHVKKTFDCSKSKPAEKVYIVANHPSNESCSNLLELKERDLQKIIKDKGIPGPQKGNPIMRKNIWSSEPNLELSIREIEVTKPKEDYKRIWDQINKYLPIYALFQSDRSSTDSDNEVQDPLKVAIEDALNEVESQMHEIQEQVQSKVIEIANKTHEELKKIDPCLAQKITPEFKAPTMTKWKSLFSISMDTDDGIPLNKRGSGVRRMILVSFFKADAERRMHTSNKKEVIYAIEEPETAQHPNSQKILIDSFYKLAQSNNTQVILTTHSPGLAQELPADSICFVHEKENREKTISQTKGENKEKILKEVSDTLGVIVDKRIRVLFCVEGPTDVVAMRSFSRCLRERDKDVIDLENDPQVAIIPLGGSILKQWVQQHYLKNLSCPEMHIYDRDVQSYQDSINEVNARQDGSYGCLTERYEIENYLNPKAIHDIYGVQVDVTQDDVPKLFGKAYSEKKALDGTMKGKRAKGYLSKVFSEGMTYEYLEDLKVVDEIKVWFNKLNEMLKNGK